MACPLCGAVLEGPELCPSCGSLEGLDDDETLAPAAPASQRPTEPLPVLFLDVDGVLNCVGLSAPEALEPGPVHNMATLLRRCGGASGAIRVVLSRCPAALSRSRAPSRAPLFSLARPR